MYGCNFLILRLPYVYDLFQSLVEEPCMRTLRKLWRNKRGQDLIEYALLAAFLAVAVGALSPSVAENICTMFSRVATVLTAANATGASN